MSSVLSSIATIRVYLRVDGRACNAAVVRVLFRSLLADVSITGQAGVVGAKSDSDAVVEGSQVRQVRPG